MLPFIFKPIPKELNKAFNFKPPISHIIIDIRTKKTLDSLEAKNRTNITIARRPGHIIIDIRTKISLEAKNRTNITIARRPAKAKTLDSLEVKNRTNIARRPAKVKKLEAKNRTNIIASYIQLLNASSPDSYPPQPSPRPQFLSP